MKILIAEDDAISRRLLEAHLKRFGREVIVTDNGVDAFDALRETDGPKLAVLDWMMPGLDGVEVCRRIRSEGEKRYVYIIILTAKGLKDDLVRAFDAGVDDYLTKPFEPLELRSRLDVGERLLNLQTNLESKVSELEEAMSHVKQLQGLIPICMHCKKIRDEQETWHRLETYFEQHSEANFTHSLCRGCLQEHYPQFEGKIVAKQNAGS